MTQELDQKKKSLWYESPWRRLIDMTIDIILFQNQSEIMSSVYHYYFVLGLKRQVFFRNNEITSYTKINSTQANLHYPAHQV